MYGPEISARAYLAFLAGVAVAGWLVIEGGLWLLHHITIGVQ